MATNLDSESPVSALLKRKVPPNSTADTQRQAKKSRRKCQGRPSEKNESKETQNSVGKVVKGHVSALTQASLEPSSWQISEAIGGRITEIDPIFSPAEDRLIVTFETAIQVYTTTDSHLTRRIPLRTPSQTDPIGHIVATRLSPANPILVWIVSSNGWVWMVDWTTGEGSLPRFRTSSQLAHDMTIICPSLQGVSTDILLISESNDSGNHSLIAYRGLDASLEKGAPKRKIVSFGGKCGPVRIINSAPGSMVLAAVLGEKRVLVGTPTPAHPTSFSTIDYTFYTLDAPDHVCCMDVRPSRKDKKLSIDLVAGCARGAIFIYKNILSTLRSLEESNTSRPPFPIKHHWHRKAVHSVKWFQDGSHVASGSSDAALVTYQFERSKTDFLPHLGASISNIAVSPLGRSIALNLDDNSCIVLSTADIKTPTAYVSGIQTLPLSERPPVDPISRVCDPGSRLEPSLVAAVLRPDRPSQLLLSVGSGSSLFSAGEETRSAPLVQAFDLEYFTTAGKQALARTLPTESSTTSTGHKIVTPEVTHLAFSKDGKWLASVDQWIPPERDHALAYDIDAAVKQHRESYLKFWDADAETDSGSGMAGFMPLVTRINAPHSMVYTRKVFDLASDPSQPRFATIGDDCTVRMWTRRVRLNDGIAMKDAKGRPISAWSCTKTTPIGEAHMLVDEDVDGTLFEEPERNGSIVFSDDGSALFVALGTQYSALTHMIDTETGEIRSTLDNMFRGAIRGMKLLHKYLITLSDSLKVYDIVQDVVRYDVALDFAQNTSLAVNRQSQTFALSYSRQRGGMHGIAVLSPREYCPLLEKSLPHAVISLLPAPGAPGFVVLDSAAQVWTIEDHAEARSLRVLKSLAEIGVEASTVDGREDAGENDESDDEGMTLGLTALAGTTGDIEMVEKSEDEDVEMDDRSAPAPISQDKMAEIFNQTPIWAMPSTSEIFYQITSLIGASQKQGAAE